jgi:RES domain-containing protein
VPSSRKARDHELLDAVDACEREALDTVVWRIVREGRDPLQGYPAGARWDPGTFDVLYTSLERDGALAEIHFHLSRQPVFPSKLRSVLHRIAVRTTRTLRIADSGALEALGVERGSYAELLYRRTQEIGDAAHFLGFDALLVPSARWRCSNLVILTDRVGPADLIVEASEPVDWQLWRSRAR